MTTTTTRSRGTVVAATALAGLGVAGAATAITLFVAGPAEAHHAPAPATHTTVVPVVHPSTPTVVPATPVTPTVPVYNSAVAAVQRELGQLNYYEGPINGLMNAQTRAAIQDLQRAAGLPQTGQLDTPTVTALITQLHTGDSQMGQ